MKAGSALEESCCVHVKPEKCMQHVRGIIPWLFGCWADPVAHLLLLKSLIGKPMTRPYLTRSMMKLSCVQYPLDQGPFGIKLVC